MLLAVSRPRCYLDALAEGGYVGKMKVGRSNYYINVSLNTILTRAELSEGTQA